MCVRTNTCTWFVLLGRKNNIYLSLFSATPLLPPAGHPMQQRTTMVPGGYVSP